jgi:hypothetical protein
MKCFSCQENIVQFDELWYASNIKNTAYSGVYFEILLFSYIRVANMQGGSKVS